MKIIINTDGGSRGNPGPSAIGVVIYKENQIIKTYSEFIGEATNNETEYQAVVFALKKAKLLFGKKKAKEMEIEFLMDSELVVKQMNHEYKIKEEKLQLLFLSIWNSILDFKQVSFKHIPREENKEADSLVNEALDGESREQVLL